MGDAFGSDSWGNFYGLAVGGLYRSLDELLVFVFVCASRGSTPPAMLDPPSS